jgi:hypothetical protein
MMEKRFFDAYTWRARIIPVFLVSLPLAIAGTVWFPHLAIISRVAGIILVPFGIAMLMSQIGRDLGKRKQPRLWHGWGGSPSTQLLRHGNSKFNPVLRDRYHKRLRELQPDLVMPSPEEEEKDPERADHVYNACVQYLISQTRDKAKFPLLFNENVNYGFRRNLWGMKPFGILFAFFGFMACCLYLWLSWNNYRYISVEAAICGTFNLGFLLLWLFWVSPSWVRIAGDAYAERLLETCEHLQGKS